MINKIIYCVLLNKWHNVEDIKDLETKLKSQNIPKFSILDFIVLTNRKDVSLPNLEVIFIDTNSSGVLLNHSLDIAQKRGYDYYFKLDADDNPLPNRVVSQLKCMELNPDKVFFSTALKLKKINNPDYRLFRIYPEKPSLYHYLINISFANCSLAINLKIFSGNKFKTTPFLEDKQFFSIEENFSKIFNQPEILVEYQLNDKARASSLFALKNFFYDLRLIAKLKPMFLQFYFLAIVVFCFRLLLPIQIVRKIRDNYFQSK